MRGRAGQAGDPGPVPPPQAQPGTFSCSMCFLCRRMRWTSWARSGMPLPASTSCMAAYSRQKAPVRPTPELGEEGMASGGVTTQSPRDARKARQASMGGSSCLAQAQGWGQRGHPWGEWRELPFPWRQGRVALSRVQGSVHSPAVCMQSPPAREKRGWGCCCEGPHLPPGFTCSGRRRACAGDAGAGSARAPPG